MKVSCICLCLLVVLVLGVSCGEARGQGPRLSTVQPAKSLAEIEKQIDAALDSLVEFELDQTTLAQLAEKIGTQFEINVRVDVAGLDLVGATPDEPITGSLRGVPLRSALRLLLKDKNLTYSVEFGVLVLTSIEAAGDDLITKTYDVTELIRRDTDEVNEVIRYRKFASPTPNLDELKELIRNNAVPDSWDEAGGAGTMSHLGLNAQTIVLTISQTQEVHEHVGRLIDDLKKMQAAKADEAVAKADKADVEKAADADDVKVQIYAIDTSITAEQGVELVKTALDDVQWAEETSFIKPIAATLVIKQSAAVHARIFKLLNDLGALRGPEQIRPEVKQPTPPGCRSVIPVVG